MRLSRQRSWIRSSAIAAIGAIAALFGTAAAQAEGLPPPPPVETWTGFSFGGGGGVAIMNADVNGSASRKDIAERRCFAEGIEVVLLQPEPCVFTDTFSQTHNFNIDDLGGEGGFGTIQLAYDKQFAPRWVLGAFVDADWYFDLDANAQLTSTTSTPVSGLIVVPALNQIDGGGSTSTTTAILNAKIEPDWSISVGGRIGWLASPSTLLYFLAAYTHAELDTARFNVSITDPVPRLGRADDYPNTPTQLSVKLPDELDGFSLGGGGEVKLGGPWALKLEYRFTHLDGGSGHASSEITQACIECENPVLHRNIKSNASADFDDLDIHTVRGLLTYHFWSGGGGYGG